MKTKQEMKDRASQLVKAQLHEAVGKVGYAPTLVEEVNEAFAGLDLVLLESSAPSKEFKKKTKGQYLFMERGDETYIISKIDGVIDGIHSVGGKGERVRLRNDSELRSFIADRAMEGFTIVRSTREAKVILRRSIRGIVSFIRKHGLKFAIIGGLIALTIAFVGPHMVPMVAGIASRLNIGGAEVATPVADARGMFGVDIEPIPEKIPDVELDSVEDAVKSPFAFSSADEESVIPDSEAAIAAERARAEAEAFEQERVAQLVQQRSNLMNLQAQGIGGPNIQTAIDQMNSEIAASPERIEAAANAAREAAVASQNSSDMARQAAEAEAARRQQRLEQLIANRAELFKLQAQRPNDASIASALAAANRQLSTM